MAPSFSREVAMSTEQHWDYSFDVVVVGSGNGGMTAALCSYEMGSKDVLVIEKSELYGGTSSISGGGVWIPCNRYAQQAGAEDSIDQAKTYLRQLITEEEVPEYQLDAYLENGPKMVDFLHERTRIALCDPGSLPGLLHQPGRRHAWASLHGARDLQCR